MVGNYCVRDLGYFRCNVGGVSYCVMGDLINFRMETFYYDISFTYYSLQDYKLVRLRSKFDWKFYNPFMNSGLMIIVESILPICNARSFYLISQSKENVGVNSNALSSISIPDIYSCLLCCWVNLLAYIFLVTILILFNLLAFLFLPTFYLFLFIINLLLKTLL